MKKSQTQRIVIIDDHPLLRKGLQQLIDLTPDMEIVGDADNGPDGLQLVTQLSPDLVVLDLNMPGMNGLETLSTIKAMNSDVQVVILTVSNAEADIVAALRSGADGYLLKDMDPEQMLEKFREVADGRVVMSSNVAECLARAMQAEGQRSSQPCLADLTDREREILLHISQGESNKVIARFLNITESTVKVHVKHILKKLGLRTRLEAALWAVNQTEHSD